MSPRFGFMIALTVINKVNNNGVQRYYKIRRFNVVLRFAVVVT